MDVWKKLIDYAMAHKQIVIENMSRMAMKINIQRATQGGEVNTQNITDTTPVAENMGGGAGVSGGRASSILRGNSAGLTA
jgi:hypothetical protein